MVRTIGNPLSWLGKAVGIGSHSLGEGAEALGGHDARPIELRTLQMSDLGHALRKGMDDFMALRTDVMFIVLVYPAIGFFLVWFALDRALVPLIFPLITGFALLGPIAAIGLYEMSRKREKGAKASWADAFGVLRSRSVGPCLVMGVYLFVIFAAWMVSAHLLYGATLGPEAPASILAFVGDVLTTPAGWALMIFGTGIGFVFAVLVLAISFVTFPLLIDRPVGLPRAVTTSVALVRQNPVVAGAWGLIIAALLGLGVLTVFIGLIFVFPVLGHASWHLYRSAVAAAPKEA